MSKQLNLDDSCDDEPLDDALPIECRLDFDVTQCDCCGKEKLKRTIEIAFEDTSLHLGVICAGRWFKVNLTGNPHYAADRLLRILNNLNSEELQIIITEIQEANSEL